jgi:bacteriocin-like protein
MVDRQKDQISASELTTEDLDQVSGGLINARTEAFHAFFSGFVKGYMDAGGTGMTLTFQP